MPLYQQSIICLPKARTKDLVETFKRHAALVFKHGGNLRSIEHHGIRPLPARTVRKFAAADGVRHYWDGRFITAIFDASPYLLRQTTNFLMSENSVIRVHSIRMKSAVEMVNSRSFQNPYIEKSKLRIV